jgi:hypothetical protein
VDIVHVGGSRNPDSKAVREWGQKHERKALARTARRQADREANRMVPTYLLRMLRDAQRDEVDGPAVREVVRLVDSVVHPGG